MHSNRHNGIIAMVCRGQNLVNNFESPPHPSKNWQLELFFNMSLIFLSSFPKFKSTPGPLPLLPYPCADPNIKSKNCTPSILGRKFLALFLNL